MNIVMVWESKHQRKGETGGKFYMKINVSRSLPK